jgi:hypothetical protein
MGDEEESPRLGNPPPLIPSHPEIPTEIRFTYNIGEQLIKSSSLAVGDGWVWSCVDCGEIRGRIKSSRPEGTCGHMVLIEDSYMVECTETRVEWEYRPPIKIDDYNSEYHDLLKWFY